MTRLLVDIGGTSVRLGWQLDKDSLINNTVSMACADFATPADALLHYCAQHRLDNELLVLAVAAQINGPKVDITNNHWQFDAADLAATIGATRYLLINDFTAQALANVALLEPKSVIDQKSHILLREGHVVAGTPMLVTGPGTGLGVAALVPTAIGPLVIEGEGGHVSYAPRSTAEATMLAALSSEFGHVSAERLVGGPGLETIYRCQTGTSLPAAEIGAGAIAGDTRCHDAVALMLQSFATVAANAALSFGAASGIVIAGGIVPKLLTLLDASGFYSRLEDHGRRSDFLANLPIYLSIDPYAGLEGAARAAESPHLASRVKAL